MSLVSLPACRTLLRAAGALGAVSSDTAGDFAGNLVFVLATSLVGCSLDVCFVFFISERLSVSVTAAALFGLKKSEMLLDIFTREACDSESPATCGRRRNRSVAVPQPRRAWSRTRTAGTRSPPTMTGSPSNHPVKPAQAGDSDPGHRTVAQPGTGWPGRAVTVDRHGHDGGGRARGVMVSD